MHDVRKKVIFNISIRGVFIAFSKLIAFITVPVIARALGPDVYGEYNFILAVASYSTLPSNWGFLAKGIREVADSKSKEESSNIVSSILSARIVLGFIFTILVILIISIFNDARFVLLFCLAVLHHVIITTYIDYYYYGNKNVWIPSIAHFISQLIYACLVVILISTPYDIETLFLLMVLMVSIESGILFYFSRNEVKINLKISLSNAWVEFKENFKLGVGLKIGLIQNSYPVLLIPLFLSNEILGNYTAVYKFYTLTSVIMQMVILSIAPYIIKTKNIVYIKRNYYIRMYLFLAFLFGLGMALFIFSFSDFTINILFGRQYTLSSLYLKWYSAAILSIAPLNIALASLMNYYSLDHKFMIGGFIQTGLILILTPISLCLSSIPLLILSLGFSMLSAIIFYIYSLNVDFKFIYWAKRFQSITSRE